MTPDGEVEELVNGRPLPRWILAVAVAVAAAAGVAVLLSAPSDKPPSHSSETTAPIPALYGLTPVATGAADSCPANVLCSRLLTRPQAVLDAIEAHLSGAVVERVRSVEYVSPLEHREAVWYREVTLRLGSADGVIVIAQPQPGDHDGEDSYLIGSMRALRVERAFFDRSVSARLSGVAGPVTLAQLRALAEDPRLVAA